MKTKVMMTKKPRGYKIRQQRLEMGMTQDELGAALGGIKHNTISQWEWDITQPKMDTLAQIAQILKCDLVDLLDDETAQRLRLKKMPSPKHTPGIEMNHYQAMAMRTMNHELKQRDRLAEAGLGLAGEAGEVVDHIKKHFAQGHDLDEEKIKEELGDLMWYLAYTAYILCIPLDDVAVMNIEKLNKRYPAGFEAEKSIYR